MDKKVNKKKPLYKLKVDETDNESTVHTMSFVASPAIERNFVFFSEQEEVKFDINMEKRIVTGPFLIPDQIIYRIDPDGFEYYLTVDKEEIQKIAAKFMKLNLQNNVDVEHNGKLVPEVEFFETFFVDSAREMKAPAYLGELPDGTWVGSYKVVSDVLWAKVKNGEVKGFSIGAWLDFVATDIAFNKHTSDEGLDKVKLYHEVLDMLRMLN